MRSARPSAVIAAAVLVAAAMVAGCSPNDGPSLRFEADPTTSLILTSSNMAPGQPLSFGSLLLCVSTPGTATITSVSLERPRGDLGVETFAVRPNPGPTGGLQLGAQNVTLAAFGAGFQPAGRQEVNGVCAKDPLAPTADESSAASELGVQVRLRSGQTGGGIALSVAYSTGDGHERTLKIPFGIWLCATTCPPNIGASPNP